MERGPGLASLRARLSLAAILSFMARRLFLDPSQIPDFDSGLPESPALALRLRQKEKSAKRATRSHLTRRWAEM